MTHFTDRLLQAMRDAGLTQEKLAERIGVRQQTIQKVLRGKIKRPKQIKAIAREVNKSVEWLEEGVEKVSPRALITVFSWADVITYADCKETSRDEFEKNKERIPMYEDGYEKCKALRITNTLMEPVFKIGDIIFVDPERKPIDGNFVVAYKESAPEAMLKKLTVDGENHYLYSLDTKIDAIKINKSIKIFGVVVYRQPPGESVI